jgi:hypothetical protein
MANTLVKTEPPAAAPATPGGAALPAPGSRCEANVYEAIAQLFAPGYVLTDSSLGLILRYPGWPVGAALLVDGARCVDGRVELDYRPAPVGAQPQTGG